MRLIASLVGTLLALVFACGPVDTGTEDTSGSGGADGGPVWSGGGGSGASDGGAPDAGADGGTDGGADGDDDAPDGGAGGGNTTASCAGVVPGGTPASVSATVPRGSGDACWYATGDEAGNIAVESHSGDDLRDVRWHLWSPDGRSQGSFRGGFDQYGQASGLSGSLRESGSTYHVRRSAAGAEQRRTLLGGSGCSGEVFLSAVGGSLAVGSCGDTVHVTRFDGAGAATATRQVADRKADAVGLTDARGNTLVVVWPASAVGASSTYAGRWYDSALAPQTDWFNLPGNGARPNVRPLIGGGAAIQVSGGWAAMASSGAAGWSPAPQWLAARPDHDFQIVRGGKAYALIPKSSSGVARNRLELHGADGAACGAGTFPADGLSVTHDGTVVGHSGEGGCNMTWWPAALR